MRAIWIQRESLWLVVGCVCWECVFLCEGVACCLNVHGVQSPASGLQRNAASLHRAEGQIYEPILRSGGTSSSFSDHLLDLYSSVSKEFDSMPVLKIL